MLESIFYPPMIHVSFLIYPKKPGRRHKSHQQWPLELSMSTKTATEHQQLQPHSCGSRSCTKFQLMIICHIKLASLVYFSTYKNSNVQKRRDLLLHERDPSLRASASRFGEEQKGPNNITDEPHPLSHTSCD